jgi:hypothetical protein
MRLIDRILGGRNDKGDNGKLEPVKPEWKRVGVYFYRADGRYPPAKWAQTPQQFSDMVPDIRRHIDGKLEVRITNSDDHLLFHSTKNDVEWDGIGLGKFLARDSEAHGASRRDTRDTAYER